jgi:predicted RNA-binding protein with PUA-like domain
MPNHWLVKTEPTEYSFADLEREKTARWTGVANPLARKYLRAMRKGDRVFVYHTGKEKQIVGVAEVVGEGDEPQLSACVRLEHPVTLAGVKARKEFADFALVRIGRLSVMPVNSAQWKLLCTMAGN